jgi:lysophospholipase L1-like esterase
VKNNLLSLFCLLGLSVFAKTAAPLSSWTFSWLPRDLYLGRLTQESVCDATTLRIMPLGDSITHGATVPGGYRIGLWDRFTRDRWMVDFVGTQTNGPAIMDGNHEGHPGKPIQFIREEVRGWLYLGRPHIVLLMIGTNDVLYPEAHNYRGATARLNALIGQITAIAPTTELIVASIPTLQDAVSNERARDLDQELREIVNTRVAQGRQVTYVDMYNVLDLADLADGVHPNAIGYDKMSDVWYEAIAELREQRCSTPVTPSEIPF